MSTQKTLALHLGCHKTGTTTVQEWMNEMDRSQELPFNYAKSGRTGNGHHLLTNAFKQIGDCQAIHDVRQETLESDFQKTFISSEALSTFSSQAVSDLMSLLRCPDYRITTYTILRNADSTAESAANQSLKCGKIKWSYSMDRALEDRKLLISKLLSWLEEVGVENFHLLPFDRVKISQQGLWPIWWNFLGYPDIAVTAHPEHRRVSNESFSALTLAVILELAKRLTSRRIPTVKNDHFVRAITALVEQRLRELSGKQYTEKLSFYTPVERRELLNAAAEIEKPLVDALGLSRPFFDDIDDASFPESNVAFLLNPRSNDHPKEKISLFNHLLEYAEALAAEQQEIEGGVVRGL